MEEQELYTTVMLDRKQSGSEQYFQYNSKLFMSELCRLQKCLRKKFTAGPCVMFDLLLFLRIHKQNLQIQTRNIGHLSHFPLKIEGVHTKCTNV